LVQRPLKTYKSGLVKIVHRALALLKLEKHRGKTFIGKITKGFDFLGYHFTRGSLTVARTTMQKFAERAALLYEHERGAPHGRSPFGSYVRRWAAWAWATAGVAPGSLVGPAGPFTAYLHCGAAVAAHEQRPIGCEVQAEEKE